MDDRLMKAMLEVDEQHWWYRGRRRVIHAELEQLPLPAGAQILDAGCGSGRTLEELERYGEVRGIELNEAAVEVARDRGHGEVLIGRLEELPYGDGTFDLITCLDVIEHTPDDRVTLTELRRVTVPGGWLLATVPAYQALWSAHDEANHHYRRYSRRTLRAVALQAGWEVARMTSFNSLLLAPAAAVRIAQRRRHANGNGASDLQLGPPWLNGALEAPLRLEARWIARGHTLAAGLSLMAVLRNPAA
ncbi:MAG TPA: class I SAM-dependent methyltransferase [Solirubrobacteraceae bacterium]|jgi:SAM-dependent methyltransferase|nr:class I SAM-dependent methyltransferase [Solirubrobacteraceae bacterium]